MSRPTKETIRYLSKLCRIHIEEQEEQSMLADLQQILKHIEILESIDTEGVAPCSHAVEFTESVMREDIVEEPLSRDSFLKNSSDHIGGMVRVPTILST